MAGKVRILKTKMLASSMCGERGKEEVFVFIFYKYTSSNTKQKMLKAKTNKKQRKNKKTIFFLFNSTSKSVFLLTSTFRYNSFTKMSKSWR